MISMLEVEQNRCQRRGQEQYMYQLPPTGVHSSTVGTIKNVHF